ncbi:hypothetical protein JOF56_010118 [Kibdelosporangium banguiense]|uniref:DUF2752 domain-containing protein n=1 Tax=Kibdelosporangium banguiense TaxID=1365924 RepID=A0ABS4TZB4_9PSEU|nr:hypothetical protein [Kibdelosporangium banguiense]MBP2329733.1 hypothetical protein [Kibdelosporangium banguiense]
MPVRSRTWIAASGGLARLVVILGLLVGLTALQGTHSREAFRPLAHAAMCPTTVHGADAGTEQIISPHGAAVLYDADTAHTSEPHFPGVIGMCAVLLVAVLFLLISIVRPGFLGFAFWRAGPQRAVKRREHRAPSLAMICVLRT